MTLLLSSVVLPALATGHDRGAGRGPRLADQPYAEATPLLVVVSVSRRSAEAVDILAGEERELGVAARTLGV
jgi:hypothetical protein